MSGFSYSERRTEDGVEATVKTKPQIPEDWSYLAGLYRDIARQKAHPLSFLDKKKP